MNHKTDLNDTAPVTTARAAESPATGGHGLGHTRMMMLMCLPMLALTPLLSVTGVCGWGSVMLPGMCLGIRAVWLVVMARMGRSGTGH